MAGIYAKIQNSRRNQQTSRQRKVLEGDEAQVLQPICFAARLVPHSVRHPRIFRSVGSSGPLRGAIVPEIHVRHDRLLNPLGNFVLLWSPGAAPPKNLQTHPQDPPRVHLTDRSNKPPQPSVRIYFLQHISALRRVDLPS